MNKLNKSIFLVICVVLFSACKVTKYQESVPIGYGINSEIIIGYRPPEYFEYKNFADTSKNDYLKLYFPNKIEDTLEIFLDNKKIDEYYCSDNNNADRHILLKYPPKESNPILTIKLKHKDIKDNCMQLVLDNRFRIMFVSKMEDTWFVTYSNFQTLPK